MKNLKLMIVFSIVFLGISAVVVFIVASDEEVVTVSVSSKPVEFIEPVIKTNVYAKNSISSYRGLGAWVDSFDADPNYLRGSSTVLPSDALEMSENRIRTLFLQSSRSQDRSNQLISDPWYLTEFLLNAHANGLDVVAWYLPKWSDNGEDLERMLALADFEVLGHKFDGLAVDIEWNRDDLEYQERSSRLVELSKGLRENLEDRVLGAIVMPPVVTDVINPNFWPEFPWVELADVYDVWLPMNYWSFRTEEHADSNYYNSENIKLLRNNLKDQNALVHAIGGVGIADGNALPDPGEPLATIDDLDGFVFSVAATKAIGGSIYDWATTGPVARNELAENFKLIYPDLYKEK
ncbi:MAG: hypothetical protein CL517_03625 [Actinobacteria bacterium]|nr:hypothetical protein [Actinomycetota bacterium]|tara:strand:+ start:5842 stop:6891 length:1050 start_codon:yes stop_codon:yes gene_type:complete